MINIFRYFYYNFYRPKIFFPKKTYSMYGEDLFINNYFKNKKNGIYLDVGAYHPLDGNNTYLLYKKKNWHGINIDVNPLSVELFQKARKFDLNINTAVSNKKGFVTLYFRKKINMLNTLSKKIARIHFRNGFKEKNIKSNTLNNILDQTRYRNKKIDFFNLDVEGHELDILESLNFKKYQPTLICVEIHNHEEMYNNNTDYMKRNPVNNLLLKNGYSIVWNHGFSYVYALNKNL
jgi:FkbM family methyltransferase